MWLAWGGRATLRDEVLNLERFGLVIRETDDTRSFRKIIPTLELYPDAVVCHRAHRIMISPEDCSAQLFPP
ncbi:hypothetical protein [Sedimentimonas flavescens]|uniref:hypothetical protein n=1 Tax=Sedimentimonas flavescens TaxID=2851012 RepID=UPI001C4A0821|nr:hypothetical protein [Sedimentimonas flavescens]MBW0158522.1 hypothetical protein [Sedimentimonas flavescens]